MITHPEKRISSFINVDHGNKELEDYLGLKAAMPDWEFKSYEWQCQDGVIAGIDKVALEMQRSAWIFHSKYVGDRFGHVLLTAMACGRPVITRFSDYKGKLGEELLEDEVTALDIDKHTYDNIYSFINTLPPEKYDWMSQQAYERFTSKVHYDDEEEVKIRKFLENLR